MWMLFSPHPPRSIQGGDTWQGMEEDRCRLSLPPTRWERDPKVEGRTTEGVSVSVHRPSHPTWVGSILTLPLGAWNPIAPTVWKGKEKQGGKKASQPWGRGEDPILTCHHRRVQPFHTCKPTSHPRLRDAQTRTKTKENSREKRNET